MMRKRPIPVCPVSSSPSTPDFEYQFAGVRVDVAGHRLRVDGREVHVPARVFELLALLCAADGRVRSRDNLLAALWSANDEVSDESLTQLVFRLRAVLGRYGETVVTVRGVGVRLNASLQRVALPMPTPLIDAPPINASVVVGASAAEEGRAATPQVRAVELSPIVQSADVDESTSPSTPPPRAPLPTMQPPRAGHTRVTAARGLSALAILTAIALLFVWFFVARAPAIAWVEQGHGVRTGDVHAEHADTITLLRTAFDAEAQGDRARAVTLLQSAHGSDARTPVAATFLAYFALGAGDDAAVQDWLAQARERVTKLRDPFLDVLLSYVDAEANGEWSDVMRTSGALLDLRPEAWRLRAARAHLFLGRGMRAAALQELQALPVHALDHRKIEMVLADRASLGDVAGAEATLARLPQPATSASLSFLKARIAYTKGELAQAQAGFALAVDQGLRSNRLDVVTPAQVLAGILAMNLGDEADARTRIGDGLARLLDRHQRANAADVGLLVAQIEAFGGNTERVAAAIAQVRALIANQPPQSDRHVMTELFALRLMGASGDTGLQLDPAAVDLDRRGVADLLEARRAVVRAQLPLAKTRLVAALQAGAMQTDYAEEASLLARELGVPAPALATIDPPYPPLARFASRWAASASQTH